MDIDQPNIKRWIVFYPVYINSKKTVAEGRRIGVSKACENPTCVEIGDSCNHLKLPFAIEVDKAYPRDFMQRGRVRVLLKKEDGSFYNPSIRSNARDWCSLPSEISIYANTSSSFLFFYPPDSLSFILSLLLFFQVSLLFWYMPLFICTCCIRCTPFYLHNNKNTSDTFCNVMQ
ncbi:signal recognition particle 19 kDa protein isoform X1 [Amborella trichopoda]|uniref:signal recognition particle 19 kDa protein isoform X1 n=1 Tax=Amborella trichopoda TaxID=13333 RepID=UPI0005D310D3|nr:signal recognition particle 19 kDa protein isoform X1 [Amborella trichopoda]|eukprot:XP_011623592.1 signal recognition particle 19 kDa protein isoform X1 [Amborella trichopoda]